MTSALQRSDLLKKLPGLEAWGDCEHQLRSHMSRMLSCERWAMHSALSCSELTRSLYRLRGLTVTHEALCAAYDLLRHGRPIDFDLLFEARYTRALLKHHYCTPTPLTGAGLDRWLRDMIVLANTIGAYEETGAAGVGVDRGLGVDQGLGTSDHSVFDVPPGPLDALRKAIRVNLSDLPPLLGVLASVNALKDHSSLFPGALDLAELLLLPGLIALAFRAPPTVVCSAPFDQHGVTLEEFLSAITKRRDAFDALERLYQKTLSDIGERRVGTRAPCVVSEILETPLFTAKGLAERIKCVPRTSEKLVQVLNAAHLIHARQRSGRLVIWSRY